jgi:predicted RNA-binding Zn-ribbon protein involved in translation (DUF1610 family)
MAKNEDDVERLAHETQVTAERVNYAHRLVGLHEPAAPLAGNANAPLAGKTADVADVPEVADMLTCPNCGTANPAVTNRSDDRQCYRCDKCGHQWGEAGAAASGDAELPPVAAIDAPGG